MCDEFITKAEYEQIQAATNAYNYEITRKSITHKATCAQCKEEYISYFGKNVLCPVCTNTAK